MTTKIQPFVIWILMTTLDIFQLNISTWHRWEAGRWSTTGLILTLVFKLLSQRKEHLFNSSCTLWGIMKFHCLLNLWFIKHSEDQNTALVLYYIGKKVPIIRWCTCIWMPSEIWIGLQNFCSNGNKITTILTLQFKSRTFKIVFYIVTNIG